MGNIEFSLQQELLGYGQKGLPGRLNEIGVLLMSAI